MSKKKKNPRKKIPALMIYGTDNFHNVLVGDGLGNYWKGNLDRGQLGVLQGKIGDYKYGQAWNYIRRAKFVPVVPKKKEA